MLRKYLHAYVLSLLLLFSQQAVATHAISHIEDQHTQTKAPHSTFCEQCLHFSSMGSAIPVTPHVLHAATAYEHTFTPPVSRQSIDFPASYTCRAPPLTLVSTS
ncbi:hypothetical protein SAMN05192560_0072 [Methylobacillus rhizosphaerae]|uniref:DUF2946 domain-containing protein n=1 Tax=Methylobacillus rhizosphaerae TaxID=551994 RepID=A0A238XRE7_9PROT|nr:hypothetical protein [Methylobacillus rhizosphaerae]SNR60579.1 hypothetical protein SAMN05192560_0072 [Methylobacillus rhizosphaerae]